MYNVYGGGFSGADGGVGVAAAGAPMMVIRVTEAGQNLAKYFMWPDRHADFHRRTG